MPTVSFGADGATAFYGKQSGDAYGFHAAAVAFVATGTDASFQLNYFREGQISVDGGPLAPLPATPFDGPPTTFQAFSGLADGPHEVRLYLSSSIVTTGFISVTGANPSIARPAWAGAEVKLADSADYVLTEGNPRDLFNPYEGLKMGSDKSIRFKQKCSSVSLLAVNYGGGVRHYNAVVDGVALPQINPSFQDGVYTVQTLISGLDPDVEHDIALYHTSDATTNLYSLLLGGTSAFDTTPLAPRKFLCIFGHSLVADAGVSDNLANGYSYLVARSNNVALARLGLGFSRVVQTSGQITISARQRLGEITALAKLPDLLVINYGRNDQDQTYEVLKPGYVAMLQDLRGILPGVPFLALGEFGNSGTPTHPLWSAIPDAITEFGDPLVQFVNTDGVITPSSDTTDGVHPNISGSAKIAAFLTPVVAAKLAPADTSAPTLSIAAINAAGTTLTLTFSEPVTGVSASNYTLSGGAALSAVSGSGATRTLTISPAVYQGQTRTLSYGGTGVVDGAGNALAAFSGASVGNGSTVPVSDTTRPAAPVLGAVTNHSNYSSVAVTAPADSDVAYLEFFIDGTDFDSFPATPGQGFSVDLAGTTGLSQTVTAYAVDGAGNSSLVSNSVTMQPGAAGGGTGSGAGGGMTQEQAADILTRLTAIETTLAALSVPTADQNAQALLNVPLNGNYNIYGLFRVLCQKTLYRKVRNRTSDPQRIDYVNPQSNGVAGWENLTVTGGQVDEISEYFED